jgi:hypothetical protein
MKRAAKTVLIGALSLGSAHAAQHDAAAGVTGPQAGKGLDKVAAVQSAQAAGKTSRGTQGRKSNRAAKRDDEGKTDPVAKDKQDGATEDQSDSTEQSVQLKGVRG